MSLASGARLGRYEIVEPLGQGGMATVYKAYQPALERTVALKVIRGEDRAIGVPYRRGCLHADTIARQRINPDRADVVLESRAELLCCRDNNPSITAPQVVHYISRPDVRQSQHLGHDLRMLDEIGRGVDHPGHQVLIVAEEVEGYAQRLRQYIADTSLLVEKALKDGKAVLFEGAQATLLDLDHGTYPYVTSSNSDSLGIAAGTGVPPRAIGRQLGVTKAYCTRVGSGPFPSELRDSLGDRLREGGSEFGATTGRPRRCAPATRPGRPRPRGGPPGRR